MEENSFNTPNNYVHSEPTPMKSGSGLSKVLAICFAITTIASMATLAYVYTSKNKDTKKLNEELVESKEKVKSANDSIAKYEEATQTKITDVKQDNVTVKEIVKPMAVDLKFDNFLDAYKAKRGTVPIIKSGNFWTSNSGKYIFAAIQATGIYTEKDEHGQDIEKVSMGGAYEAWYQDISTGIWNYGFGGHAPEECNMMPQKIREIFHGEKDQSKTNGFVCREGDKFVDL